MFILVNIHVSLIDFLKFCLTDGPSSTVCFGGVGKTLPEVGSVDKLSTPGDCPSTPPCSSHPPACYMEEEKPIIPGVTVRAAPAEKLVQLAVESFSKYKFSAMATAFFCLLEEYSRQQNFCLTKSYVCQECRWFT